MITLLQISYTEDNGHVITAWGCVRITHVGFSHGRLDTKNSPYCVYVSFVDSQTSGRWDENDYLRQTALGFVICYQKSLSESGWLVDRTR